jgi:Protein of unknown function (DUF3891)
MVVRPSGEGVVAVGQPSHAWVSGQLARAWGNERFGASHPREEVCLAAEQHDIGMACWDLEPELNPETGLPRSFMEMPLETHLELWSAAPGRLRAQSRYAALLVSMHGTALYERRDLASLDPERGRAVRAFLDRQRLVQDELLAELRADPDAADGAKAETVARNARLVWTWDSLSLALLLDWAPHEIDAVPAATGTVRLRLSEPEDSTGGLTLEPWPFSAEQVSVRCEGRRLEGRFEDEEEMRAALRRAPWTTLRFELVRRAEG